MTKAEIREEVEDAIHGDYINDELTREEEMDFFEDLDLWLRTAKIGDAYYYDGIEYEFAVSFEAVMWKNAEDRESGEPVVLALDCDDTDLDAIKAECEKCDIKDGALIEIFTKDDDDAVLLYEDGKWEWENEDYIRTEEERDDR